MGMGMGNGEWEMRNGEWKVKNRKNKNDKYSKILNNYTF